MTKQPIISRRLLLAGFWLAGSSSAWAQVRRSSGDQGIGGTGITRGNDHGIGGTGIVGVIQRFGSIFVNGQRVSYAPDVAVRIDGERASAKALRIGQLARVLAVPQAGGALATKSIEVVSEVTGPIESVHAGEMVVLGQKVASSGQEGWRRVGTHVSVFGLRRTDGVIVASLVEPRQGTATRVAGLLERVGNDLRIGGLLLDQVDSTLVGQRVTAEGHITQRGVMQVARAKADDLSDMSGASRLSIEGYVRRVDSTLQFGSGYVARDTSRFQPSGDGRVVVNAVFDSSRGLRVESVQSVNTFPGSSVLTPGPRHPASGPSGGPSGPGGPGGGPNAPGGHPGDAPTSLGPRQSSPPGEPGGGPFGPGGFGSPGGGPSGPGGMGGGGFGGGPGGGRR